MEQKMTYLALFGVLGIVAVVAVFGMLSQTRLQAPNQATNAAGEAYRLGSLGSGQMPPQPVTNQHSVTLRLNGKIEKLTSGQTMKVPITGYGLYDARVKLTALSSTEAHLLINGKMFTLPATEWTEKEVTLNDGHRVQVLLLHVSATGLNPVLNGQVLGEITVGKTIQGKIPMQGVTVGRCEATALAIS